MNAHCVFAFSLAFLAQLSAWSYRGEKSDYRPNLDFCELRIHVTRARSKTALLGRFPLKRSEPHVGLWLSYGRTMVFVNSGAWEDHSYRGHSWFDDPIPWLSCAQVVTQIYQSRWQAWATLFFLFGSHASQNPNACRTLRSLNFRFSQRRNAPWVNFTRNKKMFLSSWVNHACMLWHVLCRTTPTGYLGIFMRSSSAT